MIPVADDKQDPDLVQLREEDIGHGQIEAWLFGLARKISECGRRQVSPPDASKATACKKFERGRGFISKWSSS